MIRFDDLYRHLADKIDRNFKFNDKLPRVGVKIQSGSKHSETHFLHKNTVERIIRSCEEGKVPGSYQKVPAIEITHNTSSSSSGSSSSVEEEEGDFLIRHVNKPRPISEEDSSVTSRSSGFDRNVVMTSSLRSVGRRKGWASDEEFARRNVVGRKMTSQSVLTRDDRSDDDVSGFDWIIFF